jgi:GNAT superfamily N-acetyltransferase
LTELQDAQQSIEHFYRKIYWSVPSSITHDIGDCTLSYSGVTWLHSINQLWVRNTAALNAEMLKVAAKFFKRYGADYSIVFVDNDPQPTAHWLMDHHYVERSADPIYGLCGLPRLQHMHRDLVVERATVAQQNEFLNILYATFFMGPEIGRCAVRAEHFEDDTVRHYLAYVQGEVAACMTILLGNNQIAGVWNVGTLRPFRKQGVAATLLMRALADAASDGYRNSVLVASPMGRPLYESLGFKSLGSALFYSPVID